MTTRRLLWGMTRRGGVWGFICGAIAIIVYCIPGEILLFFGIANIPPETFPYGSDGFDALLYSSMGFWGLLSFLTIITMLLGFVSGLLIGIATRIFFFSQSLSLSYRKVIGFPSAGFGIVVAIFFLTFMVRLFFGNGTDMVGLFIGNRTDIIDRVWGLLIAILALSFCFIVPYTNLKIVHWYETEMQKQSS